MLQTIYFQSVLSELYFKIATWETFETKKKIYLSYQAIRQPVLVINDEMIVKTVFWLVKNGTIFPANILYTILPFFKPKIWTIFKFWNLIFCNSKFNVLYTINVQTVASSITESKHLPSLASVSTLVRYTCYAYYVIS